MHPTEFSLRLTLAENYRMTVDFGDGAELLMDEPPPLGEGTGPNASRVLAAAVGNCLSSSLLFCLRRARARVDGLETEVHGKLVRNERGRLRIGELKVRIAADLDPEERAKLDRCLDLFEDFCIVSASVRQGIPIDVEVDLERNAAPAAEPVGRLVGVVPEE